MGDLSANFSTSEFTCHCGCGKAIVQPSLIKALQNIRSRLGIPLTIVSGYRCPDHNKACGGATHSQHMAGTAADVKCSDLAALYMAAIHEPAIKGIGIYLRPGGWIHLDTRENESRWAENGLKKPMDFATAVKLLMERKRA
jgi:uncharacterized protein YcbK (DUF882 family)